MEAAALTDDLVRKRYAVFWAFNCLGFCVASMHPSTLAAQLDCQESLGGEAALVDAVENYDRNVDGPVHREVHIGIDTFR